MFKKRKEKKLREIETRAMISLQQPQQEQKYECSLIFQIHILVNNV